VGGFGVWGAKGGMNGMKRMKMMKRRASKWINGELFLVFWRGFLTFLSNKLP